MEEFLNRNGFSLVQSTPRKRYFSNGTITVGLTKIFCVLACEHASPGEFCKLHNDLFISPDGKVKPCRNNTYEVDILTEILNRDKKGLKNKISMSLSILGEDCKYCK